MKSQLKLIILIFLLSLWTESFAQNFGIRAGLNLSKIRLSNPPENYNDYLKMNPGFHIGPIVEFPITESLSIESGLLLSTKGRKVIIKESMDNFEYKEKLNMFYLDIPLTAKATFDISSFKIYGTFGPYIGIGLGGKSKFTIDDETSKENVKFGSEGLKRFDYGLTVGGGIVFNKMQVGINYSEGLANISDASDSFLSSRTHNRVLGISAGYSF